MAAERDALEAQQSARQQDLLKALGEAEAECSEAVETAPPSLLRTLLRQAEGLRLQLEHLQRQDSFLQEALQGKHEDLLREHIAAALPGLAQKMHKDAILEIDGQTAFVTAKADCTEALVLLMNATP